jgi:hypothetical protein
LGVAGAGTLGGNYENGGLRTSQHQ